LRHIPIAKIVIAPILEISSKLTPIEVPHEQHLKENTFLTNAQSTPELSSSGLTKAGLVATAFFLGGRS
jgi:hypothetical protein